MRIRKLRRNSARKGKVSVTGEVETVYSIVVGDGRRVRRVGDFDVNILVALSC